MPGIVRSGILKQTSTAFFALDGIAGYVAATFTGLFLGTSAFGFIADKLGRRAVFTYSLLWYSTSAVAMAFQTDAIGINFWRLMTGIGLGVELVTIDAYLANWCRRGSAGAPSRSIRPSPIRRFRWSHSSPGNWCRRRPSA